MIPLLFSDSFTGVARFGVPLLVIFFSGRISEDFAFLEDVKTDLGGDEEAPSAWRLASVYYLKDIRCFYTLCSDLFLSSPLVPSSSSVPLVFPLGSSVERVPSLPLYVSFRKERLPSAD